jgi:two-component system, NarL family, response regulator NreC
MRTHILIASDHPLSRTGLRHVLKSASDLEIVAEADAPGPVAELCRKFAPAVVVFEITVPGMSGLRTGATLVQAALPAHTVVVANNENVQYVRSLLAVGVVGYVLRKASQEELLLAIRHAASGQRYIDPRLSDGMADVLLQAGDLGISRNSRGLSRREAQVLRAVARGFTSSEIGRQLQLSSKTVETYRSRIYEKLGLRTRADLVHYAMAWDCWRKARAKACSQFLTRGAAGPALTAAVDRARCGAHPTPGGCAHSAWPAIPVPCRTSARYQSFRCAPAQWSGSAHPA